MKKYRKYLYFLIIIVIFGGIIFGFSQAKYISNSVWNYYLKSKGFYFESDILSFKESTITKNDWNGESIYFNLRNNLNNKVITSYDISYSVNCTVSGKHSDNVRCVLNGSEQSNLNGTLINIEQCKNNTEDGKDVNLYLKSQCELEGYLWERQISSKELYFEIIPDEEDYLIDDITVNINVSSTAPYKKSLKAKFILYKNNNLKDKIALDYKNYNSYAKLLITNYYEEDKCLKLKWDSNKLIIDTDINNLVSYQADSLNYLNEIEFKLNKNSNKMYTFYKKDFTQEYDVNEFTYELTDNCI